MYLSLHAYTYMCIYIYIYMYSCGLRDDLAGLGQGRDLLAAALGLRLEVLRLGFINIYIYIHILCIYLSISISLSLYIYIYIYIHMHISLYVFQIIHSPALVMPSTQSLHAFQITSFEHEIPLQESQAGDISQGCSLTLSRPWSCSRGGGRRAPRCRPRGPRRGFLRSERERERSSEFFCLFDSEESFWFLGGPLTPDTDSERSLEVIF